MADFGLGIDSGGSSDPFGIGTLGADTTLVPTLSSGPSTSGTFSSGGTYNEADPFGIGSLNLDTSLGAPAPSNSSVSGAMSPQTVGIVNSAASFASGLANAFAQIFGPSGSNSLGTGGGVTLNPVTPSRVRVQGTPGVVPTWFWPALIVVAAILLFRK